MILYIRVVLMLFLMVMITQPVSAKDVQTPPDSLEQLMNIEVTTVTGASKYQQELTDAPASVSIITADDIRKAGYRNLAEVLNSVRSFYITNIRSFYNIGVRGFSPLGDFNTRVLLMVDGYRLNDGLYEAAPLGTDFPVDMDLIDRIEVIRGPGSSLYGTNAFLAVINVITRTGKDIKGGELSASGGSFNTWTGRATGGITPGNNVDLLFSGSYRDTAGQQHLSFPEYAATSAGVAHGMDGEDTWDLMAKAAWKNLSLLVLYQNRDKTVPTAPYGTIFNDPAENIKEDHLLAGLNYNSAGGWADLNARLTYNRYAPKSDYPSVFNGAYALNRDDNVGEWVDADMFASKAIGDHLLTLGTEFRWQFNLHLHNYDVMPPAAGPDLKKDSLVQGYYLQDEYHILKQLILNAGVRIDHYENFGTTTNPRAALIWKPWNTTVLRLSYGEAFRAPNSYELYYGDGITQKGNPNLSPEKNRTFELGWDQFIGENIRTSFSGYFTRISDLLVQVTDIDGLLVFTNQNKVESKGIELGVDGKWENGFSGRLSYSYQDSQYVGAISKSVPNSPHNLVKGALTAPLPLQKSFATLEMLYGGSRINAFGDKIDGAAIFNLTLLNRDLLKGLDLSASIYNLFDKHYSAPSGPEHFNSLGENLREIPQERIAFRVKATYRF
jgi:outer membrane receptor for ferrienterochelin and colicins